MWEGTDLATTEKVYVQLLDEGTVVWRPTTATRVGYDRLLLHAPQDYDPEYEMWEFLPGETVICESRILNGVTELVAIRRATKRSEV